MYTTAQSSPEPVAPPSGITVHISQDMLNGGGLGNGGPSATQLYALADRAMDDGNDNACTYLLELAAQADSSGGALPSHLAQQKHKPLKTLFPVGMDSDDPLAAVLKELTGNGFSGAGVIGGEDSDLDFIEQTEISKGLGDKDGKKRKRDGSEPVGTRSRYSPLLSQLGAYTGLKDPVTVTGRHMKTLQAASLTPAIFAIINTRAQQLESFSKKREDGKLPGWRIRQRDRNAPMTPELRAKIEFLENLVEYGGQPNDKNGNPRVHPETGEPGVWSGPDKGNNNARYKAIPFGPYLRQSASSLLTYDSFPVRIESGSDSEAFPVAWISPADPLRIWPAIADGPFARTPQIDETLRRVNWVEVSADDTNAVVREFDHSTMEVLIRNERLDFLKNGFGRSETEIALDMLIALCNGVDFAKSYFDKNHMPSIILEVMGQLVQNRAGMEYLRQQMQRVTGPEALFKMLVMPFAAGQTGAGIKVHQVRGASGATSELAMIEPWFNFLYNIICAVFAVNSEEVGFSSVKTGGPGLSNGGQGITLDHSLRKGRDPLLEANAEFINRTRIKPYDTKGDLIFEFVGLHPGDAKAEEEVKTQKQARGHSLNEIRDEADEERIRKPIFPQFYTDIESRYKRSLYPSTSEWRAAIDKRYEKDYWKVLTAKWSEQNAGKEPTEVDLIALKMVNPAWANYTDLPINNSTAMMDFTNQQGRVIQFLLPPPAQPEMGLDGGPLPGQEPGQDDGQGSSEFGDPNAGQEQPQVDPNDPWGHEAEQQQAQQSQQDDEARQVAQQQQQLQQQAQSSPAVS